MISFLNQIIMNKFFLQKIQLSDKEIINGLEHWNCFNIGKPCLGPDANQLKISQDAQSKIVIKYSGSTADASSTFEDVLMTIPDTEEYRIIRGLVEMDYADKLECYFCELDKDKNFLKNPPKVAVFLKKK